MKTFGRIRISSNLVILTTLIMVFGLTTLLSVTESYVDDAFITYRYVQSLVRGEGLVSYPGGPRVEGYSNPSLLTIAAACSWLFQTTELTDIALIALWVNILAALTCVLLLYHWKREEGKRFWYVPAFLLASCLVFAQYRVNGLETALYTLAVTATVYWFCRKRVVWGMVASLAVALTRPEGVFFVLPLIALATWDAWKEKRLKKAITVFLLLFVLPFSLFVCTRLFYFGEWLPNTVIAKSHFHEAGLLGGQSLSRLWASDSNPLFASLTVLSKIVRGNGFLYLLKAFKSSTLLALLFGITAWQIIVSVYRGNWGNPGKYALLAIFTQLGFIIGVGGDGSHMGSFRFLVPILPLLLLSVDNLFQLIERGYCGLRKLLPRSQQSSGQVSLVFTASIIGILTLLPHNYVPGEKVMVDIPYLEEALWAFDDITFLEDKVKNLTRRELWLGIHTSQYLADHIPDEIAEYVTVMSSQAGVLPYRLKGPFIDCAGLINKDYAAVGYTGKTRLFEKDSPDIWAHFSCKSFPLEGKLSYIGFPGEKILLDYGYTPQVVLRTYPPPCRWRGVEIPYTGIYEVVMYTKHPVIQNVESKKYVRFRFGGELVSVPLIEFNGFENKSVNQSTMVASKTTLGH